jgi:hypothetical protein
MKSSMSYCAHLKIYRSEIYFEQTLYGKMSLRADGPFCLKMFETIKAMLRRV